MDRLRFTQMRNKVTQSLRKAKAIFLVSVLEGAKGNGKKVWQAFNKLLDKDNKYEQSTFEVKIDNILEKVPTRIENTLLFFQQCTRNNKSVYSFNYCNLYNQ